MSAAVVADIFIEGGFDARVKAQFVPVLGCDGGRSHRGRPCCRSAVHDALEVYRFMAAVSMQAEDAPPRPATHLAWFGFAVAAMLAEALVIYVVAPWDRGGGRLVSYLLPGAHLLLIPFLLRNSSFWGIRLVLVGFALNVSVMVANGGLMPVDEGAVSAVGRHDPDQLLVGSHIPGTKNVLLKRDDTHLVALSDSIVVPFPHPFTKAASIGDAFIGMGVMLTCGELLIRRWGVRPIF